MQKSGEGRRLRLRARIAWVLLMIGGMVVGYGPMLTRNIAVGAPLGPRYFGSAQAFAAANHPDNPDRLMTNGVPDKPERFIALMREAQARPMTLAAGTLEAYGSDWPRLLRRAGTRVLVLMMGDEIAENVAYAYFKRRVPILSLALDFWWLLPLSVGGAAALGRRRWGAKLREGLGLILLLGFMTFGLVSLVYPFGRYRLMFLPLLALLAGYGASRLWLAWRGRNWRRLGGLAAVIAVVALAQAGQRYISPFREYRAPREAEYLISSREWARSGKLEAAILELEDGLDSVPGSRSLQAELALTRGLALQAAGNYAAAVEQYREALRLAPENSLAQLGLATALEGRPISAEPPR